MLRSTPGFGVSKHSIVETEIPCRYGLNTGCSSDICRGLNSNLAAPGRQAALRLIRAIAVRHRKALVAGGIGHVTVDVELRCVEAQVVVRWAGHWACRHVF